MHKIAETNEFHIYRGGFTISSQNIQPSASKENSLDQ